MYRDTRREYIVRLLRNKDECSVSDLANYFSVTKETIRTDLAWLQKRGVVSRHHGGVSLKTFNAKCAFATRVCRYEFAYQATTAGYWLFNLA